MNLSDSIEQLPNFTLSPLIEIGGLTSYTEGKKEKVKEEISKEHNELTNFTPRNLSLHRKKVQYRDRGAEITAG